MCVRVSVCVWCCATCRGQISTCSACVPAVRCVCLVVPLATWSERHVAAVGRLSSICRSCVARVGALGGSDACLRACARCRARVCCAARPSLSACYVTCMWSHVYDVRVRGGARAPPLIRVMKLYQSGSLQTFPGSSATLAPIRGRPGLILRDLTALTTRGQCTRPIAQCEASHRQGHRA